MKVLYRVIFLYALVILLTACGGKAIATEPAATLTEIPINTPPNATEVTTALETLVPIESADPFKVTVTQYIMDTAGFHEIATELSQTQTIDPEYFSTVTGVAKVLSQTTWPADLEDQAHAFIDNLTAFAAALESDNVTDAVALSEIVHDAQHELSHEVEHWLEDAQASAADADPFDISVAQQFMNSAGFHEMATALSESQTIDPEYFSTVTGVTTVLSHTTWPSGLSDQAQSFIESLAAFAAALAADNAAEAVELSETVHDAQHELSHEIEHWLGDAQAVTTESSEFDLSIAQYFMDEAGFHEIATALSETQTIDPEYFSTVSVVQTILSQVVWPSDLNDQAQAFIESLGAFSAALEADNIADAVESSEIVHDAQHELSHSIDHFLEGQAH